MSATTLTAKKLINSRLFAVLVLGFASGLPLALTGSTLQAWFTEAHIDLITIGTLSLLGIPYTLKFIWAPLMDHYSFPRFGKRKGWILLMQLGLLLSVFLLASMNPVSQASAMGVVALSVAFFSASQDISITAYQTDVLTAEERGLGIAYYVFGYRIAMLISGGLALLCADWLGWKVTYELMAFLLLLCLFTTYKSPNAPEPAISSPHIFQTLVAAVENIMQREKIIMLFLFIAFYKIGDALALSLMTNFLLHGLGFSLSEVGLAYKLVSIVAMILGGFIGGYLLKHWNIYKALLIFGLAQTFSNLMFVALALIGKQFIFMAATMFIENFCSGLTTIALVAFMMSLCDHRYTACQFAILSTIASLGRVFLGPVAALMVKNVGWAQFFIWSFILCAPGIVLLMILKDKVSSYATATTS